MKKIATLSILIIMLSLIVSACGKQSNNDSSANNPDSERSVFSGTITALYGNRTLIVAKDANQPDNKTPTAVWVDFGKTDLKGVHIGYQVKVTTDGIMLESYPMQTKGYKLEVVSSEVGKGDVEGRVTGLDLSDTDELKHTIQVEGTSYQLVPFTVYELNGETADANALKIGDHVALWFPGYQISEERLVTQAKIIR